MSGRRKSQSDRPSHEDAKAIRRAVQWLTKIGRLDPLQAAVANDLADILDGALTNRAVVNIRFVNCGRKRRPVNPVWTGADFDALDELWRARLPVTEIAERMGRKLDDVTNEIDRLGMWGSRARPRPAPGTTNYRHANDTLRKAKERFAARRREGAA